MGEGGAGPGAFRGCAASRRGGSDDGRGPQAGAGGLMVDVRLPTLTLMRLVLAVMGVERIGALKPHAIRARCRSFSYGDASLHLP